MVLFSENGQQEQVSINKINDILKHGKS